ncbi:MAG: ATP-binding protein [Paludibacteraceae bacterium]|nr:ATP-binding protein [Paludibacteraceae bacterium]
MSIECFAKENYKHVIAINFALQKQYKEIFKDGYEVDDIIKNITFLNPKAKFVPGNTLLFFDELQDCPTCATALKPFKIDGRFDVICSGSLMGIYYNEIESNSVGYKEDYEMYSLDFEEFLWAKGYNEQQIEYLYQHMKDVKPFSELELNVFYGLFNDYMITGGMPEVVNNFVENGNFSGTLSLQKQLLKDYEEDITKYATGFEKGKVLAVYRHISTFLAKENKRFQVTKIATGARNREYIGAVEWLMNAGIINVCYGLEMLELPLKGNYDPKQYKIYYKDTGLLIASLDNESQQDLRQNKNFGIYKGALFENIVGDMMAKQGYDLFFFKNEKSSVEMDFMVRDLTSIVPIEVKANNNATASLNKLTKEGNENNIKYGIKFCKRNIGFNGQFYTFPYFLGFLLRRFLMGDEENA